MILDLIAQLLSPGGAWFGAYHELPLHVSVPAEIWSTGWGPW